MMSVEHSQCPPHTHLAGGLKLCFVICMNTPTPPSPPRSMSLLLLGIFQARWAPKVGSSGSSVSSSLVLSFFLFSFFFWEVRFVTGPLLPHLLCISISLLLSRQQV